MVPLAYDFAIWHPANMAECPAFPSRSREVASLPVERISFCHLVTVGCRILEFWGFASTAVCRLSQVPLVFFGDRFGTGTAIGECAARPRDGEGSK